MLALRLDDRERAWIIKKKREPSSIEVISIFSARLDRDFAANPCDVLLCNEGEKKKQTKKKGDEKKRERERQ